MSDFRRRTLLRELCYFRVVAVRDRERERESLCGRNELDFAFDFI